MKALILDTETSGVDPSRHRVIEVACVMYDLRKGASIFSFSSLIQATTNEAYKINQIPVDLLLEAPPASLVWERIERSVSSCDVILAHNAKFDQRFVPSEIGTIKPWCCTEYHVEWPYGKLGAGLVSIALANGLGIVEAHRAITDCQIIARLLTRTKERGHDLVKLIEKSMRPRIKIIAQVSYDDRQKAKDAGFEWDTERRIWWREVVADDAESFPFRVTRALAGGP